MSFKDHYKTLRVSPKATADEIKKAYRTLALQYHPDRNLGSIQDASYFHSITEAYDILSDASKRAAYDEQRWLNGYSTTRRVNTISPEWIIKQCEALVAEVNKTAQLKHEVLADYAEALLSTDHIEILHREGAPHQRQKVVRLIMQAIAPLELQAYYRVSKKLLLVIPEDYLIVSEVEYALDQKRKMSLWEENLPLIIGFVAGVIVFLMFALL